MEGGNAIVLPAFAFYLGRPASGVEIAVFLIAALAAIGFLVVGTLYWRGVDRRLRLADGRAIARAVEVAHRWEKPLLVLTVVATLAVAGGILIDGLTAATIAAAVLTLLAWLEYANYYHRQLQHFDTRADLKRLLTTRRLRPSHMARDLAAHRRRITQADG